MNMATKKEMKEALETFCIISNEDTMMQIASSEEDIKRGNFKEIISAEDL